MTNGSLWAMGDNQYGQLGDGTTNAKSLSPEQIVGSNVTAIAAGEYHTLFIAPAASSASPPPQIEVLNGATVITNGQTNAVNFGSASVTELAGSNITFTVSNLGGQTLDLTNVTVPLGYTVTTNPPGTLVPGSNGMFSVQLNTSEAGIHSGDITITNNDPNNNPFRFPVTGTVTGATSTNITLTIVTNGDGTVSPNPNGKSFRKGQSYTLTATATAKGGNVFSNWTGSITTNKNPLTLKLESSLVLEANFITNPFLPVLGTYNGLFTTTNGVTEATAGMLKDLVVNTKGIYSGTLLISGGSHALSGSFDLAGQATNKISRPSAQGGPLTIVLTLNGQPPPQVTGTVSGTNDQVAWVANLTADLATNTLPSAQYTMLIPPDTNNAPPGSSPGGDGYALITNNAGTAKNPAAATAKITGALADGTAFNQTVPVSQNGYVPIYATLYGNKGLLLGWINLDSINTNGVSLTWIHPQRATGLYPDGFTNILLTNQILLSPWTNPPGNIALLTNLSTLAVIDDTNVLTDFAITVSNNFKLGEVSGPTNLSGSINPKTGLLTVTIGKGTNKLTGQGAVLLNATNGGGYFLTKTNAQAVKVGP
jgi:hypothetical protein